MNGNNRFAHRVFVVLTLAVLLNVFALYTAERSYRELHKAAGWVRHTQQAENLVEHVYRLTVDAETGQRGYLLTGDDAFLEPYSQARERISEKVARLRDLVADNPVQAAQLAATSALLATRFEQMQRSVTLKRDHREDEIRDYLLSREGKHTMDSLRAALDGMVTEERAQLELRLRTFSENLENARIGFIVEVCINLCLVALGVFLLAKDSSLRRRQTQEAAENAARLVHAVHDRTRELAALSHYLQGLQEAERSKIARDIHDELGGTLAAAKIDLRMLADRLGPEHPQDARIARIMAGIDAAVQVKRRIIDDLRPTVLDSLGIGVALKRLCAQFTERLGIGCQVKLDDDDLRLSPDYSTALYRIVQEALTNTSKHAQAHQVVVSLRQERNDWVLGVADDGVGIDVAVPRSPMAHGIISMRERARAIGGEFSVRGARGLGTVIEVRVPRQLPEAPTGTLAPSPTTAERK